MQSGLRWTAVPRRPTIIQARAELGRGHALYIRGRGAGLSWRKGVPLVHVDPVTWIWAEDRVKEPVTFQLLLDDQIWAKGENFILEAGNKMKVTPDFEWPEIPKVTTNG